MRILFVFLQPRQESSGLSVYDKRLRSAIEGMGHTVHPVPLCESSRAAGYLGIGRGSPPSAARFESARNVAAVERAQREFGPDAIILSHEFTLFLLERKVVPTSATVLLCHDIAAPAYRSRGTAIDSIYAALFRRFERRLSRCGVPIGVISEHDRRQLAVEYGVAASLSCPPGVLPGCQPQPLGTGYPRTVTISGNYDWRLKRQDLKAFFAEASEGGLLDQCALFLSPGAAKHAPAGLPYSPAMPEGSGLGAGLIVDRFQAGFKLKALEYISNGMFLIGYCDLSPEFAGAPDAEVFVRRIAAAGEVPALFADLEEISDLESRYRAFQQWVFGKYQWSSSAHAVLASLRSSNGAN